AWWMFGEHPLHKATSLRAKFGWLRPLFALCSQKGILASELQHFPVVAEEISSAIPPSNIQKVVTLLHDLLANSQRLGFILLDKEGIKRLAARISRHEHRQTPYIPPRIWIYQLKQLRLFLDDFHSNREGIEACYQFCLDAYAKNFGSLAAACMPNRQNSRAPFVEASTKFRGTRYFGPFAKTAERFGIDELLSRWCIPGRDFHNKRFGKITVLSTYFRMVAEVGMRYLLNFS